MKKSMTLLIIVLALSLPALAIGGTYKGSIQGFNCVTQGKYCPLGKEDPMAAVERVFVLFVIPGEYYFIPNMDRGIMARHINEIVKVEGTLSSQHKAITAKEMYVQQDGGKWKKTWSKNMEDEIYYEITSGFPLDGS